ncbi:hypothetical protein J6590_063198 [Homalodisca vitripennis]|nr:hypothetical protein J6590_063198 [Homalodisca vitripennis]
MQIKNKVMVVTTRVILHHPPARDPRKKRLRREGYVRNRASLPGAPESRRVALVKDDEPGPGDEVQDVFPPGVGRGHTPLDGPRVEITANDNVPSGAEHALLQTINLVAEVLDGLVWGEVATEESCIPTPYPDESSATSGPRKQQYVDCLGPKCLGPFLGRVDLEDYQPPRIFEVWPVGYGLLASAFCLFECGSKNTALWVSSPEAVETSVGPSGYILYYILLTMTCKYLGMSRLLLLQAIYGFR